MRGVPAVSAYHLLAPQLVTSEEYEKLRCGLSAKGVPTGGRIGRRFSLEYGIRERRRVLLASSPDA